LSITPLDHVPKEQHKTTQTTSNLETPTNLEKTATHLNKLDHINQKSFPRFIINLGIGLIGGGLIALGLTIGIIPTIIGTFVQILAKKGTEKVVDQSGTEEQKKPHKILDVIGKIITGPTALGLLAIDFATRDFAEQKKKDKIATPEWDRNQVPPINDLVIEADQELNDLPLHKPQKNKPSVRTTDDPDILIGSDFAKRGKRGESGEIVDSDVEE